VPVGTGVPRTEVTAHNVVMSFAYVLARCAQQQEELSVLDWGGALGHYHALARALLPDVRFDYHVKELPAVCEEGRRISPEVTFYEDDSCLEREYDLVVASGSIQYGDWADTLAQLASASARYLFVTRVPLADTSETFAVVQRAHRYGYDTEYIGWVLNADEFRQVACDAGLRLVREFFLVDPFEVPGAPEPVRHGGFLFERVRD
jgi:putative methyltransferase (TIGR04325 family)